jgi:hypothetical protein
MRSSIVYLIEPRFTTVRPAYIHCSFTVSNECRRNLRFLEKLTSYNWHQPTPCLMQKLGQ